MEEIAQQFREELQEIIDRYKTRLPVPSIMHVAQDVFHKTLSVKHNPELHAKLNIETMKEMAEKYAKTNRHYVIAKSENGADYAKEVSSVTIEQAYFAGLKDLNNIHNENLTRTRETTEVTEEFIRETEAMAEDSWQSKCLWYKVNADESVYKTGFLDGYNKANGDTK